jgi:HSP20 family molecular chaperone IbpA
MLLVNLKNNNVIRPAFDSVFDSFWNGDLWSDFVAGKIMFAININETTDKYEVQVASPDWKREDFDENVDASKMNMAYKDGVLTLFLPKKEKKAKNSKKKIAIG